ncbi:hypothetical protein B0T25DRAFT_571045 [Lasiosphaeria hispida]|uniref:Peptidase S8/S53 domain-containing protein n=1 Tax=Lasiosphaeria hispida TaxID=260671 RepID=A0AAJ0HAA8_9PEZI|nr:hypothetical protein B0T25DRAFT_571045 [Lasiosphaeria hispida]
MEEQYPLFYLARDTFPWLSDQATKTASQKADPRLGTLGGRLRIFAKEFFQIPDLQKRRFEHAASLEGILLQLETALSSAPFPDSSVKHAAKHDTASTSSARQLPATPILDNIAMALREAENDGKEGKRRLSILKALARSALSKANIDFETMFSAFDDCSKIGHEDDFELEETPAPKPSSKHLDDIAGYENPQGQSGHGRHWARLRLKPSYQADESNQIPFDMLFSVSPNPAHTPQFLWQDVQILVQAPPRKVRQPGASADAPMEPTSGGNQLGSGIPESDAYERVETLCELISSESGSLLSFKAIGDQLMVLREVTEVTSRHSVQHEPSPGLHLGQFLSNFEMKHGMRPVLAYILAKAFWKYYDSDWMNMGMTKDNIYFVGEIIEDEVAYFCKPYLSAHLTPESREKALECQQVVGMIHQYPRVLALGIVLFEIATGQQFGVEGHPDQWGPKMVNENLRKLQKLLLSCEFCEDCRYPRYKAAVSRCLDPTLFKNAPFNLDEPGENLKRRRSILYGEVVDPLRQLIVGTGLDSELDRFEQTALSPRSQPRPATGVTIVETPIPAATKFDPWLNNITKLNRTLRNGRGKSVANGIPWKIAILDTGYDGTVPAFDPPGRSSRIKAWKDLVSDSSHPVDTDGHGTHLLALLLKLECPADIYVARVAESSLTLGKLAENAIAEAIRIAAKEWKVDFVSLSFGFSYPVEAIRDAIADAVYSKGGAITFFAASNNEGFNSNEMFPASLGAPVISVRGTNRNGAFDSTYNPALSSDESVFGTLGVDVVSDWPGVNVGRSMSGCSVATPIAATIAAMLLEYAVASPKDFNSEDLRLMRTRRGVFEMFKGITTNSESTSNLVCYLTGNLTEIGVHAGDRRYYVAPFSFFKLSGAVQTARLIAALGRHPERR